MTDDRMALMELVEKQADGDLVREMLAFAAERIMEAEIEVRTGAAKGTRSPWWDDATSGRVWLLNLRPLQNVEEALVRLGRFLQR